MSQWLHIVGCLQLNGEPADDILKNNKEFMKTLPFPEKQIIIESNSNSSEAYVLSLPKWEKVIDDAMSLLPSGEFNKINYSANQNINQYQSVCSQIPNCINEYIKDKFFKIYDTNFEPSVAKNLKKAYSFPINWVNYVKAISVSISDDIRGCDSITFIQKLEKAIRYLVDCGMTISGGYIEWLDDFSEDRYAVRVCGEMQNQIKFMILDHDTNKVKSQKIMTITYKYEESSLTHEIHIQKDKEWVE